MKPKGTLLLSRRDVAALLSLDECIAAVGADNEEKQELDPGLIAASKVVVDSLDQCAAIGDLKRFWRQPDNYG